MTKERTEILPQFEPLGRHHNRAAFSCSHPELENFVRRYALQQAKRRISATTVLLVPNSTTIIAYHTLSATRLDLGELPTELERKYPKYEEGIPATLLGRLAVATGHEGKGFGAAILMNAIESAYDATRAIGSAFLIVRAIDDRAFRFYEKYGFEPLPDESRRLFLPMSTIGGMLDER